MSLWLPGRKGRGGWTDPELGINMYTLLYLKQITSRNYYKTQGTLLTIL